MIRPPGRVGAVRGARVKRSAPHYYQLTTKRADSAHALKIQCTGRAAFLSRSSLMGVCVRYRHFIWPSLFWAISRGFLLLRNSFSSGKPVRRGPATRGPRRGAIAIMNDSGTSWIFILRHINHRRAEAIQPLPAHLKRFSDSRIDISLGLRKLCLLARIR